MPAPPFAEIDDAFAEISIVRRAASRDPAAFRQIMQTHNRRLYRLARSVVRSDGEAEDVVQEAYLQAFAHLGEFRGESSLSTWLSRIVLNEALGRLRKAKRAQATLTGYQAEALVIPFPLAADRRDPEHTLAQREILRLVERATDDLPDTYRTVFVARVIEGFSVEETAALLGLRAETVKTRLHRARALIRKQLNAQIGPVLLDAFPFAGARCARMIEAVMARLALSR